MSLTSLILRSALIGLTVAQAVLLPQGGCCCAADRLMAMVSGDHSDPPACCRVAETRQGRESAEQRPSLTEGAGPRRHDCHCTASACDAPQGRELVKSEATSCERIDRWEASQPILVIAVTDRPVILDAEHSTWDLSTLRSGQAARIALQSWRC